MSKLLIVVDYQNDFVAGALGFEAARALEDPIADMVKQVLAEGGRVLFTRDTHQPDYLNTREGKFLPVPHCIYGTQGWEVRREVAQAMPEAVYVDKPVFGSAKLPVLLRERLEKEGIREEGTQIELVGLCTDICVVSNAILLKTFFPKARIVVDASCCAGVTPKTHRAALETMRMCQIDVCSDREGKGE